ncbi:Glyoxylase, beta-lactamase superfamily II [Paenibacillus sp. NFR01]|nr:Glyoxylase, beta-lactamase superfamily II [Paenibacillus sp. NFR01]
MGMAYGSDYHGLPVTSVRNGKGIEVAPDLFQLTVQIVNVVFVGEPNRGDWVMVDAGMPNKADEIIEAAEERFGTGHPPKAIVLTHGHFDHVGSIIECSGHWNVDVFAHEAEFPYLTGKRAYMTPDPSAAPGLVAKMSPWFPNEPIQLGNRLQVLPADGSVPYLPGWRWLLTGGHTPGHVSLFKDESRSLIAGDAFVTVKQESIYKVFMQELEFSGPPKYFTPDWKAAKASVLKLAGLNRDCGHGSRATGRGRSLKEGFTSIGRSFWFHSSA